MSTPFDNAEFVEDPEILELEARLVKKKEAARVACIQAALEVEHLAALKRAEEERLEREEEEREEREKAAKQAARREKKREEKKKVEPAKKKQRASEDALERLAGLSTPRGVPQVVIPVRPAPKKVSFQFYFNLPSNANFLVFRNRNLSWRQVRKPRNR